MSITQITVQWELSPQEKGADNYEVKKDFRLLIFVLNHNGVCGYFHEILGCMA